MEDEEGTEDFVVNIYNEDGSVDLEVFSQLYSASISMISDLVTFLEEKGYREEDFRQWRLDYQKRILH